MEYLHNITHSCRFHELNERKSEQNLILIYNAVVRTKQQVVLSFNVQNNTDFQGRFHEIQSQNETNHVCMFRGETRRRRRKTDRPPASFPLMIDTLSLLPRPIFLRAPLIKPLDCLSDTRENETLNIFNNSGHRYAMTVLNFLSFFFLQAFFLLISLAFLSSEGSPLLPSDKMEETETLSAADARYKILQRRNSFSNRLANVLPGTLRSF